jgi:thymidylate synthase
VFVPESTNLSLAWAEVFLALMARPGGELGLVVTTIDDFDESLSPAEVEPIRKRLDAELEDLTGRNVADVADTIFPISLWNPNAKDAGEVLYKRFERIWPRLRKRSRLNAKGMYFQRMVAYDDRKGGTVNQLQHVIETYKKGNHRRSALQASIFDPIEDHSDARISGFPCLQQIAFTPMANGLTVTGQYVLQYAVDRAYGNYLGLCRLGHYMSTEMGVPLKRVICISNNVKLGRNKAKLNGLAADVQAAFH